MRTGPQAGGSGGEGSVEGGVACGALVVGEGDHEDGVSGRDSDGHDGSHEGGDGEGGTGEIEHPEDAAGGSGEGAEDDEGVEPALEVDDHQEIDEEDGEDHTEA